jgi:predicted dithiol-disulfide oxidoreductase (DUF899 family)
LLTEHRIATQAQWQAERDELLKAEKELTRRGDELARKRRELPWVPVETEYTFQTADGSKSLAELFDGRSQLGHRLGLERRYRLQPRPRLLVHRGGAETVPGGRNPAHGRARRAHVRDRRAGIRLRGTGPERVARWDGTVSRTYVTTARGLEVGMAYYGVLDRTPKGRDESTSEPLWVRRHDEYAQTPNRAAGG